MTLYHSRGAVLSFSPPEGGVARETEAAAEDGGGGSATTGGASLERQTGIWMKFEEFRKAFS